MNSSSRRIVHISKICCHLIIIAMAVFFNVCMATHPWFEQMKFSWHYVLHTLLIVANIYPSRKYANLYQVFWLVLILILTLISTNIDLVAPDSIPALGENYCILYFFSSGLEAPRGMDSEAFARFFVSGISWIIVFTCFVTSLILGNRLKKSEEKKIEKINNGNESCNHNNGDETGNLNNGDEEVKQQITSLLEKMSNFVKNPFNTKKSPQIVVLA